MLTCLLEAQTSGIHQFAEPPPQLGSGYPEWILARMTEALPTKITCDPLGSTATNSEELINLPLSAPDAGPPPVPPPALAMAERVLHEVAHAKGFTHPEGPKRLSSDYDGSIHRQLEVCSSRIAAGPGPAYSSGSLPRSSVLRETQLAPVGLGGGIVYGESTCPGATVGRGLRIRLGANGAPRFLGLSCRPSEAASPVSYTWMTGGAGTTTDAACAAGEVLVGAFGGALEKLESWGPLCAPQADVQNGIGTTIRRGEHGRLGVGLAIERRCPPRMMVKSLHVEGEVARVVIGCQDLSDPSAVQLAWSEHVGDDIGSAVPKYERCPGRSGITALLAVHNATLVKRLGAWCLEQPERVTATLPIIPAHGNSLGLASDTRTSGTCPGGTMLRGFRFGRVDQAFMQSLQGVCGTANTAGTLMPVFGNPNPHFWTSRICPNGTFVTGWSIYTDADGVKQLYLACRPL